MKDLGESEEDSFYTELKSSQSRNDLRSALRMRKSVLYFA